VYIRGSKIRFVIVPDMMKNAPMFHRVDPKRKHDLPPMGDAAIGRGNKPGKGRGRGRGRGTEQG